MQPSAYSSTPLFPRPLSRLAAILGFLITSTAWSATPDVAGSGDYAQLRQVVDARANDLAILIRQADQKGLATGYATVSQQVIGTFLIAAQNDHDHVANVREIFGTFRWKNKADTNAAADRLATDELRDCIRVADQAIAELRQQLKGEITLSAPPDLAKGKVTLGKSAYYLDGRPIFPSSLVWLPHVGNNADMFGNLGGGFYQLTSLREDGTVVPNELNKQVTSTTQQAETNAAPLVYFFGHKAAPWMSNAHPEILHGERNFTRYDIDSPLIRNWIKQLCAVTLPAVMKASGDQPTVNLLANEPDFATAIGGWKAKNGVSALTMQKYRDWIAKKYSTVEALNKTYGSTYKKLSDVKVTMPIDPALRGGPVWYDWCRFNMDRVNDWFTFLKETTQANDPKYSPVTIKKLGHVLIEPVRDTGMDLEYLTQLEDIPGADLRVVPQGTTFYGKNENGQDTETGWGHRYAYLWMDQSMMLEFTKSLCPDKVFYDSEWHGFSTVGWRNYHMTSGYVRSALWLAFTHGMGAINPWIWGRQEDGSFRPGADFIGELPTQPIAVDAYGRVMKELNAQAPNVLAVIPTNRQFVLYYCNETAIQSPTYMAQMRDVYETLKLLNVTTGFTTPSKIHDLDIAKQVVFVSPTPYISAASLLALRNFQQAGGRIVLVGAKQSFLKNELGQPQTGPALEHVFASIPMTDVMQLLPTVEAAIAPVRAKNPVEIAITDESGKRAYGVIACESQDSPMLVLNNVSKEPRKVSLKTNPESAGSYIDILSGKPVQSEFTMRPCDVRMVQRKP